MAATHMVDASSATKRAVINVHDELMSLTLRMVGEYPEFPAGSVMRCVGRAVRGALLAGTPREQIPAHVESAVRDLLAGRLVAPRRASAMATAG
ncbi:hypothetical protein [Nocardioides dilutus]